MTKEIFEILSSIGLGGVFVAIFAYLYIKKLLTRDVVEPILKVELEDIKKDIEFLKNELNNKEDKFEEINKMLIKNNETMQEIKTIFNLIKDKIEINFKER